MASQKFYFSCLTESNAMPSVTKYIVDSFPNLKITISNLTIIISVKTGTETSTVSKTGIMTKV